MKLFLALIGDNICCLQLPIRAKNSFQKVAPLPKFLSATTFLRPSDIYLRLIDSPGVSVSGSVSASDPLKLFLCKCFLGLTLPDPLFFVGDVPPDPGDEESCIRLPSLKDRLLWVFLAIFLPSFSRVFFPNSFLLQNFMCMSD